MTERVPSRVDDEIGVQLRAAREQRGVSQSQLADAMRELGFDFHQQTIYKIESGNRKVTVGEATGLAEALGLWSVVDLLRGEGSLRVALMTMRMSEAWRELHDASLRALREQVRLAKDIVEIPHDANLPEDQIEELRDELRTDVIAPVLDALQEALSELAEDNTLDGDIKAILGSAWTETLLAHNQVRDGLADPLRPESESEPATVSTIARR